MKGIIILYSIVMLLYWPVDSRMCNLCSCDYHWDTLTGSCTSITFLASCVSVDVGNQYCAVTSFYSGNYELRQLTSVARDTFQDSHFFQVIETITLSNTTWLPSIINYFAYGCDWDNCNDNELSQYFPDSFEMHINHTILNSQLLNGQPSTLKCESCINCINELTATVCQEQSCSNGSCYIDEIHNYILTPTNNCTYTFFSVCQPFDNTGHTPMVRIRATYYIDFLENQLEIDEVDIICTKDLCNSIETVEFIKTQIQTTIYVSEDFRPSRPNDTITTTVPVQTTTVPVQTTTVPVQTTTVPVQTTTVPVETTTAKGSHTTRACLTILLNLILFTFSS